jgi:hypothetical protein
MLTICHRAFQHVTYLLVLVSVSFLIYLYASLLLALYRNSGRNSPAGTPGFISIPLFSRIFSRGGSDEGKRAAGGEVAGYELVADGIELGRPKIFDADDEDTELGDAYWRDGEMEELPRSVQ